MYNVLLKTFFDEFLQGKKIESLRMQYIVVLKFFIVL